MPPMPPGVQRRGPSWFDKLKMGALMGGTVGSIMGFIYGVVTIFQYGAGQAGIARMLGKYMVGSGATFAVFMGVGSIIRTETSRQAAQAWARSNGHPLVHPRRDLPYSVKRS